MVEPQVLHIGAIKVRARLVRVFVTFMKFVRPKQTGVPLYKLQQHEIHKTVDHVVVILVLVDSYAHIYMMKSLREGQECSF